MESIELDGGPRRRRQHRPRPHRAPVAWRSCGAGRSSPLARTAGFELPIQSHPLQALVSGLLEEVLPCVVMSNAVHVYVSQAHKGELVMGAGVDSYNSYAQRGSFHVIEHQMAAALELFPIFAARTCCAPGPGSSTSARTRRRSSGLTPVENLFVNCGWGTGGFKATPGAGWVYAYTIANDAPHELNAAVLAGALRVRGAHRRARRRRGGALMLLIRCPWCGERDEVEFRYGGAAHVAYPARPRGARRRGLEPLPLLPPEPAGPVRRSAGCTPPAAGRWFNVVRDTTTHAVAGSCLPGERPEHAR